MHCAAELGKLHAEPLTLETHEAVGKFLNKNFQGEALGIAVALEEADEEACLVRLVRWVGVRGE